MLTDQERSSKDRLGEDGKVALSLCAHRPRKPEQSRPPSAFNRRHSGPRTSPYRITEATSLSMSSDCEHVSQPPAVPHPREASEEGPELALPVQLIDHTSHMTLSSSGDDSESLEAGNPGSQLPDHGDSMTPFLPGSAAQPSPGIEQLPTPTMTDGPVPVGIDKVHSSDGSEPMVLDLSESEPRGRSDTPSTMTCVVGQAPVTFDSDSNMPCLSLVPHSANTRQLYHLPTEVLLHILGYLDVSDLLATSRTSHLLRTLSVAPILHHLRLRRTREILPPMLASPSRPSLADLIRRSIFMTHTTVVSRKLARSLVSIRLSRRLAARPSAEVLVERCVLPPECIPGKGTAVAPALVARKRAIERERVKDGLRRWIGNVWRGEVQHREEDVKKLEERVGIGRVWRLRRFWERMGTSSGAAAVHGDARH